MMDSNIENRVCAECDAGMEMLAYALILGFVAMVIFGIWAYHHVG